MQSNNIVSLPSDEGDKPQQAEVAGNVEEQRTELRELTEERLFVQITQADDRGLLGKTLACQAVDASAHGLKFIADDFIPVGSTLDLWVDDKSRPGKFFLSGDVRWTEKTGKISTMVGVRLQDGLATDIEGWKEVHASA